MTHCEKCIHYDMCKEEHDNLDGTVLSFFPHNSDCHFFKNKADFEEVKHGEWYQHNKKEHGDTCFYCSVCEKMALSDCLEWELTNYCPHCGADMRGVTK